MYAFVFQIGSGRPIQPCHCSMKNTSSGPGCAVNKFLGRIRDPAEFWPHRKLGRNPAAYEIRPTPGRNRGRIRNPC